MQARSSYEHLGVAPVETDDSTSKQATITGRVQAGTEPAASRADRYGTGGPLSEKLVLPQAGPQLFFRGHGRQPQPASGSSQSPLNLPDAASKRSQDLWFWEAEAAIPHLASV